MRAHTTKQIQILDSDTKSCTRSVTSQTAHSQTSHLWWISQQKSQHDAHWEAFLVAIDIILFCLGLSVLTKWTTCWRTRQRHAQLWTQALNAAGEGTHPNVLDTVSGEVLIPSILQHWESRSYGGCRHGKQMRLEPPGANTHSRHSLVNKAVMKSR